MEGGRTYPKAGAGLYALGAGVLVLTIWFLFFLRLCYTWFFCIRVGGCGLYFYCSYTRTIAVGVTFPGGGGFLNFYCCTCSCRMHILNFAGNILVFCTSPMFLRVSGAQAILAAVGVKKGYIIIDIQAACKRKMTKKPNSCQQSNTKITQSIIKSLQL